MKTILVTGSSGLVGNAIKSIQNEFTSLYSFIFSSSKECDLLDYDSTNSHFQKYKPDYVIHLAANVGGLFKNMNNKVDMLEKNLLMNFNVVKCCYENKVEKLICMLSTCIFPDKVEYPIVENMLHNGHPHFSNDAYSYAKRMGEIHCRAYNENFNTNYCCIIPTNIYGPYDNFSLEDGHVIPALIHKCYIAKKLKIPFEIRGTGSPMRQFIFSEDLARYTLKCFEKLEKENIIISPEVEYSIREVSIEIAKAFDYEDNIVFNSEYSDGQYKKTVSNSKLMSILPEVKFIDIKEGIPKTVKFFNDNYDICRK